VGRVKGATEATMEKRKFNRGDKKPCPHICAGTETKKKNGGERAIYRSTMKEGTEQKIGA